VNNLERGIGDIMSSFYPISLRSCRFCTKCTIKEEGSRTVFNCSVSSRGTYGHYTVPCECDRWIDPSGKKAYSAKDGLSFERFTVKELIDRVNKTLKENFESETVRDISECSVSALMTTLTGLSFSTHYDSPRIIYLTEKCPTAMFKVINKQMPDSWKGRTVAYKVILINELFDSSIHVAGLVLGITKNNLLNTYIDEYHNKLVREREELEEENDKANQKYFNSIKTEMESLLKSSGMSKKQFNELMDKITNLPHEEREKLLDE
jgi:hypothetical protein